MGYQFGHVYWVERDRLFDFLSVLVRTGVEFDPIYPGERGLSSLVWPDGRCLPFPQIERIPVVPVFSGGGSDHLEIPFEMDETLREYWRDLEQDSSAEAMQRELMPRLSFWAMLKRAFQKPQSFSQPAESAPKVQTDVQHTCGFEFSFQTVYNWRDDEPLFVRVEFLAPTKSLSSTMSCSESAHTYFQNLAREGGATAQIFDYEGLGDDELLWLDGQPQSFQNSHCGSASHPRIWRRRMLGLEPGKEIWETELEQYPDLELPTQHEWMEILLASTHPDPGIRAWICQYLLHLADNGHESGLERAYEMAGDDDWRVRAAFVQHMFWNYHAPPLKVRQALWADAEPEVRDLACSRSRKWNE